jgi:hypothetical protein
MDQTEDSRELERKIAQANRIASSVSDQTTVGRLLAWAEDLRCKLQQHREATRRKDESESARASCGGKMAGLRPRLDVLASGGKSVDRTQSEEIPLTSRH